MRVKSQGAGSLGNRNQRNLGAWQIHLGSRQNMILRAGSKGVILERELGAWGPLPYRGSVLYFVIQPHHVDASPMWTSQNYGQFFKCLSLCPTRTVWKCNMRVHLKYTRSVLQEYTSNALLIALRFHNTDIIMLNARGQGSSFHDLSVLWLVHIYS